MLPSSSGVPSGYPEHRAPLRPSGSGTFSARVNCADPQGGAPVARAVVRSTHAHRPRSLLTDHTRSLVRRLRTRAWSPVALSRQHSPLVVLIAPPAVQLDSHERLACGLTAHSERSSDLGVGGSLAACGCGEQVDRVKDRVSGVSCVLEVLQRPLRSSERPLQRTHGRGDAPPRVSAFARAHDNGSCHRSCNIGQGSRQPGFSLPQFTRKGANSCKHLFIGMGLLGAPGEGRLLISSYISRREHPSGSLHKTTENKNDPRETAISGGQITKAARA